MQQIERMRVTPKMAREWLETAGPNRNLSDETVDDYTYTMRVGEWVLSEIYFDRLKQLRDGQHRMHAVVRSGKSIYFNVHWNCSEAEIDALDHGRLRRLAQQVHMKGDPAAFRKVPLARLAASVATGRNITIRKAAYRAILEGLGLEHVAAVSSGGGRLVASVILALVYARPLNPDAVDLLTRKLRGKVSVLTADEAAALGATNIKQHAAYNKTLAAFLNLLGHTKNLNHDPKASARRFMRGVQAFLTRTGVSSLKDSETGYDWITEERGELELPSLEDIIPEEFWR